MSLYDLMRAGVSITNLDATEDNVAAVADETPAAEEETPVEEAPASEEVTEEVVETTETPEGEEVVESSELETELLEASGDAEEVAEDQAKVDSIEEQIDEAEEAAVATESLIHNLIYTKANGGITPAHAELVHEHVQYIGKQLGWGKRDIPQLDYSMESFSTVGALSLTQESILQAAKNMLTKIIQSIIEGVNWVIQQGVNIWNKLFSSFEKMGDTARKLLDYANTKSGATKLKEGHEMITTPAVKAVHGEKADAGLLPAIGQLKETTKELVNNWLPMKIQAQVEELIDGLNANLNGGIVKAAEAIGSGAGHVAENGVVQSAKDAINGAVDKVKNFDYKNIDIKAIAEGIKSGSLNFVKDAVVAISDFATSSTPFVDRNLDKEKLRLYGVDIRPTEAAKGSRVLPGNRVIVLVYPNPAEFSKAAGSVPFLNIGTIAGALMSDNKVKGFLGTFQNQVKDAVGGIPRLEYKMVKLDVTRDSNMEIKVPKMNELIAATEGLIELCDDCAKLKKHLDSTASFYKKVQRKLSIAKNGLAVKAKFTGSAIQKVLSAVLKWVRSALGILREPGASFCSYMVGELSQIGSLIRTGVDSYVAE
jgi:hypothetical protein|nr:MAG TPA: internal head protein [Caudoviricetes sp.]